MAGQNEDSVEDLRNKFSGPYRRERGLPHKPAVGRKFVDAKGRTRGNKLAPVFNRVFWIKVPGPKKSYGTAFALDIQNKRYLVTASHVIEGIGRANVISIFRGKGKGWTPLEVTVVGKGDAKKLEEDIAMLAADIRLPVPTDLPFNTSVVDMFWGQHVYFCGFPYGFYTDVGIAEGHPIAMTKGAVLSGWLTESSETEKGDEPTGLSGMENTGLINCPSIMRAIKMIKDNPIGFEISSL